MIRKNWWKILAVLLMLYTLIAGLAVPLKPGILRCDPFTAEAGTQVELQIETYNTHLNKAKDLNVWLKFSDDQIISAFSGEVDDRNKMRAVFNIPQQIEINTKLAPATLIIDSEIDGPAILPSAITIKNFEAGVSNTSPWVGDIRPELHVNDGFAFPFRNILYETIRNTFFHVAIWMAMFALLILSIYYSIQYLRTRDLKYDHKSNGLTTVAIVYGLIGIVTGSFWAKHTWGTYWNMTDIKLNMAAVTILLYLAYWLLRSSVEEIDTKARLAAMYNIFAALSIIPLLFIIPRLQDSLHPGNGGNPALGGEDLDNTLRMVFYPAILGLSFLGYWMANIYSRLVKLEYLRREKEYE